MQLSESDNLIVMLTSAFGQTCWGVKADGVVMSLSSSLLSFNRCNRTCNPTLHHEPSRGTVQACAVIPAYMIKREIGGSLPHNLSVHICIRDSQLV